MLPQVSKHTPEVFKNPYVQFALILTALAATALTAVYFYHQVRYTKAQLGKIQGEHEAMKAHVINEQQKTQAKT
jgi:cell division protein FtsL